MRNVLRVCWIISEMGHYMHKAETANRRAFNFPKLYVLNEVVIKMFFFLRLWITLHSSFSLSPFRLMSHHFIDNGLQRTTLIIAAITKTQSDQCKKNQIHYCPFFVDFMCKSWSKYDPPGQLQWVTYQRFNCIKHCFENHFISCTDNFYCYSFRKTVKFDIHFKSKEKWLHFFYIWQVDKKHVKNSKAFLFH